MADSAPTREPETESAPEEDMFLPYRDRMVYVLALGSLVFLMPFVVNHFVQGRWALGVTTGLIVAILVIDAAMIYRGKPLPIPLWALAFPIIVGFMLAFATPLYISVAWAYPSILLFYFILPRRTALIISILIIVTVTSLMMFAVEPRLTTRIFVTLIVTSVLANVYVKIIEDLHRKLVAQTITDALTGAHNRRHMDATLAEVFAQAHRGLLSPAVLFIDVDHFKQINDELGHAAGDTVLKGVVATIRERMRATDRLFRSGGEEFLLLLPNTSSDGAASVAEDIRARIATAPLWTGRSVTASIGVSPWIASDTLESWLRNGDAALYRAKSYGRNRVVQRDMS